MNTVHRFVSVKIGPENPNVDDIVQETLIGATSSIGALRGESRAQVAAWLLSIARHKVADHLRARYRHANELLQPGVNDSGSDPAHSVDEVVIKRDRAHRVRQALSRLTPEQEEVLILRFILGFDISEVAEMTRRPSGAVKSMQRRALARLQQTLAAEETAWR